MNFEILNENMDSYIYLRPSQTDVKTDVLKVLSLGSDNYNLHLTGIAVHRQVSGRCPKSLKLLQWIQELLMP